MSVQTRRDASGFAAPAPKVANLPVLYSAHGHPVIRGLPPRARTRLPEIREPGSSRRRESREPLPAADFGRLPQAQPLQRSHAAPSEQLRWAWSAS